MWEFGESQAFSFDKGLCRSLCWGTHSAECTQPLPPDLAWDIPAPLESCSALFASSLAVALPNSREGFCFSVSERIGSFTFTKAHVRIVRETQILLVNFKDLAESTQWPHQPGGGGRRQHRRCWGQQGTSREASTPHSIQPGAEKQSFLERTLCSLSRVSRSKLTQERALTVECFCFAWEYSGLAGAQETD